MFLNRELLYSRFRHASIEWPRDLQYRHTIGLAALGGIVIILLLLCDLFYVIGILN